MWNLMNENIKLLVGVYITLLSGLSVHTRTMSEQNKCSAHNLGCSDTLKMIYILFIMKLFESNLI